MKMMQPHHASASHLLLERLLVDFGLLQLDSQQLGVAFLLLTRLIGLLDHLELHAELLHFGLSPGGTLLSASRTPVDILQLMGKRCLDVLHLQLL